MGSLCRLILWTALPAGTLLFFTIGQYWFGYFIASRQIASNSNKSYDWNLRSQGHRHYQEIIQVSEILPNCGITKQCPDDTFPVHVYTGQDKDDQPRLCIHGKYVLGSKVNGGGRGLNAAIVDSVRFQIISIRNFDLYSKNSTALEIWLNELQENDIIIAFTFDEASKELSKKAKASLYRLGSGKIQDLQFRSQWFMISQKGISGFTTLEKLTFAKNDKWGKVIDERLCVPRQIPSIVITPDPLPRMNMLRNDFCLSEPSMLCENFCDASRRHETITPALLTNRTLIGNTIYSTPVLVIVGEDLATLVITLESLISQPGIHIPSVILVDNKDDTRVSTIAKLFGFQLAVTQPAYMLTNNGRLFYGMDLVKQRFPNKKHVIVIEDGLILSPDFFYYMTQMLPILESDDSLLGISAWNPNGYTGVSSDPYTAYRVEDFPGLGFLIPMRIYDLFLASNQINCCHQLSFLGWKSVGDEVYGNIIIPDISRVMLRPSHVLRQQNPNIEHQLFTTPRTTNTESDVYINESEYLTKEKYQWKIAALLKASTVIQIIDDLIDCNNTKPPDISTITGKVFSIYYREHVCGSTEKLKAIANCFHIHLPSESKAQGMYHNIFRFTVNGNHILLVEETSSFNKENLHLFFKRNKSIF